MAVNNEFYKTINELTNRSITGAVTVPIDAATWVDYGKAMQALDGQLLANGFLKNLLNRVKVTVDTFRTYKGKFLGVYRDTADFGVIEMYKKKFYESRKAPFIGLKTGDQFPFTVYLPDEDVTYFTDTNARQTPITIQTVELRGAFDSPEKMDRFIDHIFSNIANSLELQREQARRALIVNGMRDVAVNHKPAGVPSMGQPVQYYDLIAMYNNFSSTPISEGEPTTALSKPDFVRFAVSAIQAAVVAMGEVTDKMNGKGEKTFSANTHIVTAQPFKSAVTLTAMNTFNDNYLVDGVTGETVSWWETPNNPMLITANNSTGPIDAALNPVYFLAVAYDEFTFGEFVDLNNTTSQYNGEVDATNYYYNDVHRYVYNESAPLAVFGLGTPATV